MDDHSILTAGIFLIDPLKQLAQLTMLDAFKFLCEVIGNGCWAITHDIQGIGEERLNAIRALIKDQRMHRFNILLEKTFPCASFSWWKSLKRKAMTW